MTMDELCDRHHRIGLNANALIYLFESGGVLAGVTGALVDAAESGRVTIIVSALVLAEIATGPISAGDEALAERYADEVRSVRGLHIVPLTADLALDAAIVRGRYRASVPDAIHLATARQAGATAFVTNDRAMPAVPGVRILQLSDYLGR